MADNVTENHQTDRREADLQPGEAPQAQNTATSPDSGASDTSPSTTDPAHDANVDATKGQLAAPVGQETDNETFDKMAEQSTNAPQG